MKTSVVKVQIADGATVFLPGRRRPVSFLGLVSHLVLDVAQIPLLAQSSDPEVLKLSAMRIVVDRSKLSAVATLLHCGVNTTAEFGTCPSGRNRGAILAGIPYIVMTTFP